jgi:hypothetical protein
LLGRQGDERSFRNILRIVAKGDREHRVSLVADPQGGIARVACANRSDGLWRFMRPVTSLLRRAMGLRSMARRLSERLTLTVGSRTTIPSVAFASIGTIPPAPSVAHNWRSSCVSRGPRLNASTIRALGTPAAITRPNDSEPSCANGGIHTWHLDGVSRTHF